MHTIEENTTLVGTTELRSKMKDILKALKHSKVVLENRNKPFAVLVPLDRYKKMEELLEILEDRVLGYVAKKRDVIGEKEYLNLDQVEKKLRLR